MGFNKMSDILSKRAGDLRSKVEMVKNAGFAERVSKAPDLVLELADFLVELAEAVEAVTPFYDEVDF